MDSGGRPTPIELIGRNRARSRPALPALIVCWGELLWDWLPTGPVLGGAPANVAYHAAALGSRAALVSRVGRDDLGDRAIAQIAEAGVDVRCIQRDELATGVVDVSLQDGEPHYHIRAPAAWDRIVCDDSVRSLLADADAFCFGTLSQRTAGPGGSSLHQALDALPRDCLRVCDVNARPPFDDVNVLAATMARADVIKLNQAEYDRLGAHIPDRAVVVITRGSRGSDVHVDQHRHHAPGLAIAPNQGDRIGAGDAFTAAFLHSTLRGCSPAEANRRANRYAAFVASSSGATPAVPADVISAVNRPAV
jgi:fructokinase